MLAIFVFLAFLCSGGLVGFVFGLDHRKYWLAGISLGIIVVVVGVPLVGYAYLSTFSWIS